MSDEVKVTQKVEKGATDNEVIGIKIETGLSVEDATKMAFAMFREYYPQLRQDALEEVRTIVESELRKIPTTDIQPPTSKIVVPLLQNASVTEDVDLRKMYAKLLASDMNKKKKSLCHPAYVDVINQMSGDDAKLFQRVLEIDDTIPVARITFNFDGKYLVVALPHYYSPYFTGMEPWDASFSMENLSRLSLINFFEGSIASYDYEKIKRDPFITKKFEIEKERHPNKELSIKMTEYVIQMNDFGRRFAVLCL